MADDSHPAHLSPSELGTKDYWETFYARTLSHLSTKHTTTTTKPTPNPNTESSSEDEDESEEDDIDDDSDPGTSWFSEHNAPDKVLQFLTDEEFPLAPVNTNDTKNGDEQAPSILDLGTGNGSMLALLRKRGGYKGAMVGIDYSIRSVQLARELQRLRIHSAYLSDSDEDSDSEDEGESGGKDREGGDTNIRFEEWDILHGDVYQTTSEEEGGDGERKNGKVDWFPYDKGGFDIVLDKGTFDAVSLSDEVIPASDADAAAAAAGEGHASGKTVQRRVCERYPGIVRGLVRKGGFVVVTSCNWTEEELVAWFTRADSTSSGGDGEEDKFVVWGRVEYPRFRFGGREGQGVCTVCFQRV